MMSSRICCVLMLVGMIVLAGCNLGQTPEEPSPEPPTEVAMLNCDELVTTALERADEVCATLGRNQACYGNRLVNAELQQGATSAFNATGDIADLSTIRSITTAPLDEAQQVWGIAVLKVQADLPDTLPGQNVTVLLYGDAKLNNVSPQMRAVTFETGITSTTCESVPEAAMVIQSPEGTQATLNINGATVTMGSTLYLRADPGDEMTIATIEGQAIVSAENITRIAQAGAQIRLPLGGENNLEVIGPPSEPEPFEVEEIVKAPIPLLERNVAVGAPISTTNAPPTNIPAQVVPTSALPCTPRTDWTATYTIQRGDTLFNIASRFNLTLAQLQQGNCISNPNQITVGQVLRVPFQLATAAPPTATVPAGTPTPTNPNLRADSTTLKAGECTTIRWDVANISQVYFEGQPTVGSSNQQVCPQRSKTYTLLVIHPNGDQVPYTLRIEVVASQETEEPPQIG